MSKPDGINNLFLEPEIGSYEELKQILTYEKDLIIKNLKNEIDFLMEENFRLKKESDNNFQDLKFMIEGIVKLSDEVSVLKNELAKINIPKKKKRKEVILDEKTLKIFQKFFEESIKSGIISHFKLKKEIESRIKNLSDREVLYFILQQTVIYRRGMVILKEKEIIYGVKNGSKIWTKGTALDKKTVSSSLNVLENMKIIFRYHVNKHKVIYFLNIPKCHEILQKLINNEISSDDIENFLNVDMRKGQVSFFDFPQKDERGTYPQQKGNMSPLKEEGLPFEGGNLPLCENQETYNISGLQKLSTIPINNIINDINKIQTIIQSGQNFLPDILDNFQSVNNEIPEKLESLLDIWKINNQVAGALISKKGEDLNLNDLLNALKMKITIPFKELKNNDEIINSENSKLREKFFNRLFKTIELINFEIDFSEIQNNPELILTYIEKYLKE